jgi:hypothetical protein
MANMEKGPRRRTSTAIHDRHSIELCPSQVLSESHLAQDGIPPHGTERKRVNHKPFPWVWTATIVSAIIFGLTICVVLLAKGQSWDTQTISSIFTTDQNPNALGGSAFVGIQLHPEEHVYREPRTLRYDWLISSEFRSPDGVRKNVYLINSK